MTAIGYALIAISGAGLAAMQHFDEERVFAVVVAVLVCGAVILGIV